jgi:hypothetical protein
MGFSHGYRETSADIQAINFRNMALESFEVEFVENRFSQICNSFFKPESIKSYISIPVFLL